MAKLPIKSNLNIWHYYPITTLVVLALCSQLYYLYSLKTSPQLILFSLIFGLITVALLLPFKSASRNFSVLPAYYLLSTFSLIVAWRLVGLANMTITVYLYFIAMLIKFLSFMQLAYQDIHAHYRTKSTSPDAYVLARSEWHLFFVRMLIGFILIPHFCEKLFAGSAIRMLDVKDFTSLGVPYPLFFVFFAGLCELGGAFSIGCGFMTRLGSIGLSLYLIVATLLGNHEFNGFIWAGPGGGWEYPFLWTCLILSFVFFGAGNFSLDYVLKTHFKLPKWILFLMGGSIK